MRTTARTPSTTRFRTLLPAWLVDGRLLLMITFSCIVSALAYQAPPSGTVDIGWLGDRLFLSSQEGLGDSAGFYADDLTPDSPTQRSRWARQDAAITLPNLGAGVALDVALVAQGWPDDLVGRPPTQPLVSISADGIALARFTPQTTWQTYHFAIPAAQRIQSDLVLTLHTSDVFTDTLRGVDTRPKGVRLARVAITPAGESPSFALLPPAWPMSAQMILVALLIYGLLLRLLASHARAFVVAMLATGALGVVLAATRVWAAALLSAHVGGPSSFTRILFAPLVLLLGALLVGTWRGNLLRLLRALLLRYSAGRALGYGLVAAVLVWLCYALAGWSASVQLPGRQLLLETFPDSLLFGLFSMGLLALAVVRGREGLPRLANGVVAFLDDRWAAPLLVTILGVVWIGYEALAVWDMSYVGHADYADNAVVARNLLAGRGWVVDYVTQFYRLYPSLTHPQETWPLLQPVWIALSFAIFGVSAWAAKVPNLVCNVILLVLMYRVGAQVWDRRVGLTAALLLLTNQFFFRLTIYTTSDLAFVVMSVGALYALYRYRTVERESAATSFQREGSDHSERGSRFASPLAFLIGSGILTGLMILQKPSSGIMAAGMGLWLVYDLWPTLFAAGSSRRMGRVISHVVLWGALAAAIVSPYVLRNMIVWGKPVHSTESLDAWVLSYRGDTPEAWDDIYRIYEPSLGGPGTPDRSWILRWGFDQTIDKIERQVVAIRDYLLPPWSNLPAGLGVFVGRDGKQLLFALGAWLALAGLIAAVRTRRRLLGLLAFTFVPYNLFLIVYWHTTEERYFVVLLPWLALLASWAVWACYRRLAAIGDGRWAPLALVLAVAAIVGTVQPSWPDIARKVQDEPLQWQPDLDAYAWIRAHTPPGTAMMTRTPWQLNWHTERPALMIPNTADRDLLLQLARRYGVQYLVLETLNRPKGDSRRALGPLVAARTAQPGEVIDGFELVYASPTVDNRVLIYRLPLP